MKLERFNGKWLINGAAGRVIGCKKKKGRLWKWMCGMNLGNKEEKDLKIENAKKNIRRKENKYVNEWSKNEG